MNSLSAGIMMSALFVGPALPEPETDYDRAALAQTANRANITLRLVSKPISLDQKLVTREELRTLYRSLLQATARRERPDPYQHTESLVALHHALTDCKRMSHSERKRMHTSLEGRLKQMQVLLRRDLRTDKKQKHTPSSSAGSRSRSRIDSSKLASGQAVKERTDKNSLAGPAEIRNAQNLIALIKSTIDPDSWDINGGKGTAMFYSPLNVLVIRNTAEVHHSIGSTLPR